MDFIEKWFGISPDGGDGSTELLYFAAIVAIGLAFTWWHLRARASKKPLD